MIRKLIFLAELLLAAAFLLPLCVYRGEGGAAAGTLPLGYTVTGTAESGSASAGGAETAAAPPAGCGDSERTVRVKLSDGTVATMTMGAYLWGVVAAEMPASFEEEALKAQAVAARTYTLSRQSYVNEKHPDADVCADPKCCQAYIAPEDARANWGDAAEANAAKITSAVAETDGLVITYDGSPIRAVFFSSAGGRTEDAVSVWGGDVPYLVSVSTPEGEEVPNYHTTVTADAESFRAALSDMYPDADLSGAPETWLGETVRDDAGDAKSVSVGGVAVPGTTMRALFSLRSANFTLTWDGSQFVFAVTGYGHGVGMSQYGANALAGQGCSFTDILKWYYTGVNVEYWRG